MMKKLFKWISRILILLIAGVLIFGTIKQALYDSKIQNEFEPNGKFSDIGNNKIHYNYLEKGNVTFVMIAGLGETMHTWSTVADELNKRGRVFMYDRSGLGFSEEGIYPRSVENISKELHTVLKNENIPGPYILIGHSLGGFIARYYAKKYPDNILGLYLVDPSSDDVSYDDIYQNGQPFLGKLWNWSLRNMYWSGIPSYIAPDPPHPTYGTSKALKTYGNERSARNFSLDQFRALNSIGKDMPLYILRADNEKVSYNEINKKWINQVFDKYSNKLNKHVEVKSVHHIHIHEPKVFFETLDEFLSLLEVNELY